MTDAAFEHVLRRDRAVVAVALAAVTALAWGYVLWFTVAVSADMPDMAMPGMDIGAMMAPALKPWSAAQFAFMFAMWAAMMVGMMTPSAAPMILIYARVGREARRQGKPFAATGWFAAGYLLAWAGFALIATSAQWALERAALLTPMMASASNVFGGVILIAAGLYQWTPLKDVCLRQCQTPLLFIHRHGGVRRDPFGALSLGLRHGGYCVGCCWVLMALLFVGGVMNLLWIAALTVLVLSEKLVPSGRLISRIAGIGFAAAGAWLFIGAWAAART